MHFALVNAESFDELTYEWLLWIQSKPGIETTFFNSRSI